MAWTTPEAMPVHMPIHVGWALYASSESSHAHQVPRDDLIDHVLGEGCPCGPEEVLDQGEDGDAWMVLHHALDGRERHEARHG